MKRTCRKILGDYKEEFTVRARARVCVRVRAHARMRVCASARVRVCAHMHARVRAHARACVRAHARVCARVRAPSNLSKYAILEIPVPLLYDFDHLSECEVSEENRIFLMRNNISTALSTGLSVCFPKQNLPQEIHGTSLDIIFIFFRL